jgi:hypothetical protein
LETRATPTVGSGTYGTVWLESCHSGCRHGEFRAVKEITKAPIENSLLDYSRELEAVIKFSHEKVRLLLTRAIISSLHRSWLVLNTSTVLSGPSVGLTAMTRSSLQWNF